MLNLLLVVCVAQLSLVPYEQACIDAEATGKPMLVIVESDNCPPCVAMKHEVLEPMAAAGELQGFIVTTLRPGSATEQMKVKVTPTLVGFRKREQGWFQYKLEGRQSLDRVRQLVKRIRE